jgi:hypothetical protein
MRKDGVVDLALVLGLDAEEVDARLRIVGRLGDVSHRAMAFYLAEVDRRGLYQVLGAPSTVVYGTRVLGMARWTVRELLETGRRLEELRAVDRAFEEGRLPWSKVRLLCKVAVRSTEQAWLEEAQRATCDELHRVVRRVQPGERPPAGDGLPGSRMRLSFELPAAQWQKWLNAKAKLCAERGIDDGVNDFELLEEMLDMVLSSDADGSVPGRRPVNGSVYKVVVRATERGASVLTPDGPEPVEPDDAERILEGAATPERLRREVFARDGHRCIACHGMRRLHAHHVVFRSRGGPTRLDNLATLCAKCHGLLHEGFLDIEVVEGAFEGRDARHRSLHEWRTCATWPSAHLPTLGPVAVAAVGQLVRPPTRRRRQAVG